jgi:hypothetical protein
MKLAASLLLLSLIPGGLTVEEFTKLHKELQPSKDDTWRTIPWKVSLAEAVEQAAKEKKPVFMWSMDGHPMGCT